MTMDDSLDGGPPSVGSGEIPILVQPPGTNTPATPASTKKVKKNAYFVNRINIFIFYICSILAMNKFHIQYNL